MSEEKPPQGDDKGNTGGDAADQIRSARTEAWNKGFGEGARKIRDEVMSSLGVKDLDEARKALDAARAAVEEKAKAEGKTTELLEGEKKRAAELEATINALRKQTEEQALKNAFITAVSGKVVDIEAAWKLADLASVKAENGTFEGMDKAVEALLKARPFLAHDPKSPPKGSGTNPPGGGNNLPASIKDMSDADFAKLQEQVRSGKTITAT